MTWKNSEQWKAMKDGSDCPFCKDIHMEENQHSLKITELETSFVRLPRNQYWKGWVIVALKKHATELFDLSREELAHFWEEVSIVASAVNKVYKPIKINYTIYGNLCPHIHCHIFPQYVENDPHASIDPHKKEVMLSLKEYEEVIHALQQNISQ